ncbi:MAG: hypothetical protein AB7G11_07260 [Phycisphaerales bacterium]
MSEPRRIPRWVLVVWLALPIVIVALLWVFVLEPARHRTKAPMPPRAVDVGK